MNITGEELKALREQHGMSQTDITRQRGIQERMKKGPFAGPWV